MQAASVGASSLKKPLIDEPPAIGGVGVPQDGDESDAEARKVPEMVGKASSSGVVSLVHSQGGGSSSRRRGAGPAEKEHKRMKRLLRNRVSAQQARERKKAYLSDLEVKTKELEQRNAELEERVSTLQRENFMLRQIVKNTAIKNNSGNAAGLSRMEN